ncbi:MAG TPA: tetratricopeptide repeat protein [Humisphaera sp.]|jgi:predicted O-linked N-acetylglucosamine transferase (SPINDLY family)|nr:tetratricopeptide repeat protein [Humisphaera sp.]
MTPAELQQTFESAGTHVRLGRAAEAEEAFGQILSIQPDHIESISQLALLALRGQRYATAIQHFQRAVTISPSPALCANLGLALAWAGRLPEAIVAYQRAIELNPSIPEVHFNLGHALQQDRQLEAAMESYRHALALRPAYPQVLNNIGNLHKQIGQLDQAIAAFGELLALQPRNASAWLNFGNVLQEKHQYARAVKAYEQAIAHHPDFPEAHFNLAHLLHGTGSLDRAAEEYRRALAQRPQYGEALNSLGNLFKEQGDLDQAIECYRKAIAADGKTPTAHSNLVYTMHFHPGYDMPAISQELVHWNARYAQPLAGQMPPATNDRAPNRKLRVGYVSANFRHHPVGRFLLPLMSNHDRAKFEIACYSDTFVTDAMTARQRACADLWRETRGLSDAQLAEQIRADGIDILVDLTMHTDGSRLLTFACKPAPVQVTYLAYCGTTGLGAMDYRLTDPYLDPMDAPTPHYGEKSIHLPRSYWCYPAPEEAGEVSPLPAARNGYVTFGCLNSYYKVTPPIWSAWYEILRATPASRLILYCPEGSHRQKIVERFVQSGLEAERLQFVGRALPAQYFQHYRRIDIALDPYPHGGGTTTCDALWMGVPVISLAGEISVSRSGLSILSNVGLAELVARRPEEYVQIAARLTGDLRRLADLRAKLRQRMLQSPLMDGPGFARDVEGAFRKMWANYRTRISGVSV